MRFSIIAILLLLSGVMNSFTTVSHSHVIKSLILNHSILCPPTEDINTDIGYKGYSESFDSIITYKASFLKTESDFTIIYLCSGRKIEKVGCVRCVKHNIICLYEPPCCANNINVYNWYKYIESKDSLLAFSTVFFYEPMKITESNICWNKKTVLRKADNDYFMRNMYVKNDTEEDYDLRKIGNIIYKIEKKQKYYELGFNKQNKNWRLCAAQTSDSPNNNFIIGWVLIE